MIRHLPKRQYVGLTVVLSGMSRFDRSELLTGNAGYFFNYECLMPETTQLNCDIRQIDDKSPLLPNTKCVLLLGSKSFAQYTGAITSLDENRGSPIIKDNIPCIASFSPQDAMDKQNFEKRFNDRQIEDEEEMDSDEIAAGELYESKGRGKTSRENYRFWLKEDTKKALRIVANGGQLPKLYEGEPSYHLLTDIHSVTHYLGRVSDDVLFYDCETDFISTDIRCFCFSFECDPLNIYLVPVITTDYKPYFGDKQHLLWNALYWAVRKNTLVAHNGKEFDYMVLAKKYRIPINRVYDTLISAHRCLPKVEKSLGHLTSLCTYEPYHKNEGVHAFRNWDQALQLMQYCGKDVFTMYLVKKWQDKRAAEDEGLAASIKLANDSIKPYMTATVLGMKFNDTIRQERISKNDRLMEFYLRIMQELIGPNVKPLISNQKCTEYFHNQLKYKVVGRTPSGNASLKEEYLYKLAQSHENPVIKFLIKYRQIQKESGSLNFNPYIV